MRLVIPLALITAYALMIYLCKDTSGFKLIEITIATLMIHGIFSGQTAAYGIYWFAAAYGYVIPAMLFVLLMVVYKNKGKYTPLLCVALCLSSEQAMAMTLVWIIGNMIWDVTQRKRIPSICIISLILSFCAALLFVGSPASRARMTSENNLAFSGLGIADKLANNIDIILETMLYRNGRIWPVYYLTIVLFASINLAMSSEKKPVMVLHSVFACLTGAVVALTMVGIERNPTINGLVFLYFTLTFVEFITFGIKKADRSLALAALSTGASVALLLIMPEIPGRTFIPFILLSGILAAGVIANTDTRGQKVLLLCCLIAFTLCSSSNLKRIYSGYKENATVLGINESRMIEASDRIKSGEDIDVIEQYKMPYAEFAGQMPYDYGVEFMTYWIDSYYQIPYDKQYIWYDYPSRENPVVVDIEKK